MSLADPISLTIAGVATSMPRLADGVYATADGNTKVTVTQNATKERVARVIRLDKTVVAADPISAVNKSLTATVYIGVNEPKFGFTDTELGQLIDALKAFYVAGIYNKVLGGER